MAEDYARRVTTTANQGCVAIVLSLARSTGIIDVLKVASKPLTSTEIAAQKQLKERYVRETLGALSAAQFVHVSTNEEGKQVYHLTNEEKEGLSRDYSWPMIGVVGFMSGLYRQMVTCFDINGPYGFHYDSEGQGIVDEFMIAGSDDLITSYLTLVPELKDKLEMGIEVAEFGCGRGNLLSKLALQFPKSKFTAVEYSSENVKVLQSKWGKLPNMNFSTGDLCDTGDKLWEKAFDWTLVKDVIHDLPRPQTALDNLQRSTRKDGGLFTLVEPSLTQTGNPEEAIGDETVASFYAMSVFACVPESYENDKSAALGCVFGKQLMKDMIVKAGFELKTSVEISEAYTLYICHRPDSAMEAK